MNDELRRRNERRHPSGTSASMSAFHRRPDFDLSPKDAIKRPTPVFQDFLTQYFLKSDYYVRGDEDRELPGRLTGEEREAAIELILRNLNTWHCHIIDAAARLQLRDAVPILNSMLLKGSGSTDCIEQFSVREALYRLGAMPYNVFAEEVERFVRTGKGVCAKHVLLFVNRYLTPEDARRVIDL